MHLVGAGGLIFLKNQTVKANTYAIQVGKGGDGDAFNNTTAPLLGKNGNNSRFSYHSTSAVGEGGGGSRTGVENGGNGGSGGGSAFGNGTFLGGIGVMGQGFNGGNTDNTDNDINRLRVTPYSTGGGGAGGAEITNGGNNNSIGSDGGIIGKYEVGTFNFKERFNLPINNTLGEFFNENAYFAGGGSGGLATDVLSETGGNYNYSFGGKGDGGGSGNSSSNAISNTGGGGGGGTAGQLGRTNRGNGGSDIVIIRYKTTKLVVSTGQQTGYLNYTNADGWLLSQVSEETTSPFTNVMTSSGTDMFQVVANAGTQLNNPTLEKLFITTVGNSVPKIANNTMIHHLEVNGSTRLNGTLNIVEQNGTVSGVNNGSIILDHENNGGASSITFRSRANRGSDCGYIQYQDTSSVGAGGESARLIIGTQNDADDHLILAPSGNVGLGNANPSQKLTLAGNINASGNITPSI